MAPVSFDAEAPFQLRSLLPLHAGGGHRAPRPQKEQPSGNLLEVVPRHWLEVPHTHEFTGRLLPRECLACEGLWSTDNWPFFAGMTPERTITIQIGAPRALATG